MSGRGTTGWSEQLDQPTAGLICVFHELVESARTGTGDLINGSTEHDSLHLSESPSSGDHEKSPQDDGVCRQTQVTLCNSLNPKSIVLGRGCDQEQVSRTCGIVLKMIYCVIFLSLENLEANTECRRGQGHKLASM